MPFDHPTDGENMAKGMNTRSASAGALANPGTVSKPREGLVTCPIAEVSRPTQTRTKHPTTHRSPDASFGQRTERSSRRTRDAEEPDATFGIWFEQPAGADG